MKKTFIVLAAMLVTSIAAKAWEVGDFYDQDPTGVPALVVYVDESGEHGLIMAPQAFTDKDYKDFCKEIDKSKEKYEKAAEKLSKKMGAIDLRENEYSQVVNWLQTAPRYYFEKVKNNKITKSVYAEIATMTNEYGMENQNAIIAYCKEKNIDLETYFFATTWAIQLGEGWFIPGNHELELFSMNFSEGLGKDIKYQTWLDRHNEWTLKLGLLALPTQYNGWIHPQALFPDYNLASSTFVASSWAENPENKAKITSGKASPKLCYHLVVYSGPNPNKAKWALSWVDQYIDGCNIDIKVVAFKYF